MWDPKTVPINQFYASAFVLFELLSREVNSKTNFSEFVWQGVPDLQGYPPNLNLLKNYEDKLSFSLIYKFLILTISFVVSGSKIYTPLIETRKENI